MARRKDKKKAIRLRLKGFSYSQIKDKMGLSKSTLSNWLSSYPLPEERIRELRDWNPRKIERCRNTKAENRQKRLEKVYGNVSKKIARLNNRDLFIAGIFLYWGEGSKSEKTTTGLSNTDPSMLIFFLKWLRSMKVDLKKVTVTLHLYSDMNCQKEINFWKKTLALPSSCFKKSYVKKSKLSGLTYKNGFGHGTCNIRFYNRDLAEYVHMAMKYLATVNSKR